MNLFSDKICNYCKEDPGYDNRNPILWDGFYDADMKMLICSNCKKEHYEEKFKTEHKGLYSEFPVYALKNEVFYPVLL